ncbi:hypothetical protein KGP65_05085 [Burkholderia multivorans]|uniref:hypothetical protein n=1 Tax=Burkholderia multivorans TaxID=87883 RepID=UPI00075519C4|nr:hypothetical protein [Burkholderia multivorans]KVT47983.1 hypothetical protein WK52_08270 [Burkholderia multivorans]MBU9202432.1 hypothetical protein [Burkholderia multivorans]MCA8385913.1 hypothetical protein [Burkholderia multivorans]MCO8315094.1 hypothetical protein [Burkholderia multivorans]MCO8350258.1 hypothetical protein [Burkholderia multivorans]
MTEKTEFRRLIKRAITAYSGGIGMVVFALVISLSHGAGLKPLLILLPLFAIVFGGITYQLIKELRALKREKPENRG